MKECFARSIRSSQGSYRFEEEKGTFGVLFLVRNRNKATNSKGVVEDRSQIKRKRGNEAQKRTMSRTKNILAW